ncbi:MAG: cupin domain-containing protein [Ignavibacteriaceae bacterium]|nr:cupin domain-containing protein [Ignavibacteriaceae bacterium]
MKIVAMIPARLGSQRIAKKNIRLINGKPLISYIIEASIESEIFEDIYINSEAELFSHLAESYNIKYYKRPENLSSNQATNDDFTLDFLQKIDCDTVIQLLPTSPFIKSEEIKDFVNNMIENNYETQISVKDVQIESIYNNQPINFDQLKQTPPSQLLKPVKAYACGIMGWDKKRFLMNMEKYGAAYHGGDGSIGFYDLKGYSTVDIDTEDDFLLAEAITRAQRVKHNFPEYYSDKTHRIIRDADRERILESDGVKKNILNEFNKEITDVDEIIRRNGLESSWSYTLVDSKSNCATLIAQLPGEGNRFHFHNDWDEWWYILRGKWEWFVEGKTHIVKKGELVYIERNKRHKITCIGNEMGIRLAVSRADVDHIYDVEDF